MMLLDSGFHVGSESSLSGKKADYYIVSGTVNSCSIFSLLLPLGSSPAHQHTSVKIWVKAMRKTFRPFALLKDLLIKQQQQEMQWMAPVRWGGVIWNHLDQPSVPVPRDSEFNQVSLSSWKGFSPKSWTPALQGFAEQGGRVLDSSSNTVHYSRPYKPWSKPCFDSNTFQ